MEKAQNVRLSVEMLGLPASGKTALSSRVADILNRRGIPASYPAYVPFISKMQRLQQIERWIQSIPFVIANLGYVLRSARILLPYKDRNKTYTHKFFRGWIFASYSICHMHGLGRVNLFCQALLQLLWSVGFGSKDGYLLTLPDYFLSSIHIADLVVVVEADLETLLRRWRERPVHSRLEKWLPESPFLLDKGQAAFNDVKKILAGMVQQRQDVEIIVVDNSNDSDLQSNAMRIADVIGQLWNKKLANPV